MKTLLFIFFSGFAIAHLPLIVEVPETEVEISIYDLVGKSKGKTAARKHLPKDYGSQVAKILEEKRPSFTGCLENESNLTVSLEMELKISGDGKGRPHFLSKDPKQGKVLTCLEAIFADLAYPKHEFTKEVTVKFPLSLERNNL